MVLGKVLRLRTADTAAMIVNAMKRRLQRRSGPRLGA